MSEHHIIGRVEEITIESEDRGFELHILTTDEGRIALNVHGCAVDLYNEVVSKIGPWISERLDAGREYRTGISGDPLLQGVLDRIREERYDDPDEEQRRVEAIVEGIDLARKAAKENGR